MTDFLKVEGLTKIFTVHALNKKTIHALDGVSFSMEEGEILGLTGSSGSGKSSLMKCIYRTYLPTSGKILFRKGSGDSVDLVAGDEHTILSIRRSEMTYCSQFLQVIPRVPTVDVVAGQLQHKGVDRVEAAQSARKLLEELGLPEELWDAYPSTFSGGEQQRVNIARAVISRPRFLLVDEPTASLDARTKDVVIDLLRRLRDGGSTIILISHDAHTLDRMADRRLELDRGKVRAVVEV